MGILQTRILEWVAMPSPGDLPNPGIDQGLPHCRWILYQLSHKEAIMEAAREDIMEKISEYFSDIENRL